MKTVFRLCFCAIVALLLLAFRLLAVDPNGQLSYAGFAREILYAAAAPARPQPRQPQPAQRVQRRVRGAAAAADSATLLTYIYAESDPEATSNLEFFLEHAVQPSDFVQYVIVLQEGAGDRAARRIVTMARERVHIPNLHFVRHPNRCFDVGTFGELLQIWERGEGVQAAFGNQAVQFTISEFTHFAVINSGVRGPFRPIYDSHKHWLDPFIHLLQQPDVKLVGPTIGCGFGQPPHVQSYLWVFDASTLALFKTRPSLLACYATQKEQVEQVELGASKFLLDKGFNIASLMLRYEGVDFRKPENGDCNGNTNPLPMAMHNGVSLDALEVMFIKYKERFVKERWDHVLRAQKYAAYAQSRSPETVTANAFQSDPAVKKELFQAVVGGRTQADFDHEHYRASNYDLKGMGPQQAWGHFAEYGFAEARPHRWLK